MKYFSLIIIAFIVRCLFIFSGFSGDVNNHISWGIDILTNGPVGVYSREFVYKYHTMTPTYPPIALALFTGSEYLYRSTIGLSTHLNSSFQLYPSRLVWFLERPATHPGFFKFWAILADVGLAVLIYKITKNYWLSMMLICLNPALVYNSSYWGQIESIPVLFTLLSLHLIKKPFVSVSFFTLALLTKQSTIIFIPLYALFFLRSHKPKTIIQSFVVFLTTFFIISLPFSFTFSTYVNKIQTGSGSDYVTDHAFNFWSLLTGLGKIHDTNYRLAGYLLFAVCLIFIIKKISKTNIYWAFGLTTYAAFLFLTRMHERYLGAAIPFLAITSTKNKSQLFSIVLVSLFNFANMYHNWWEPFIPMLRAILETTWLVNLSTLGIILIFFFNLLHYSYHHEG